MHEREKFVMLKENHRKVDDKWTIWMKKNTKKIYSKYMAVDFIKMLILEVKLNGFMQ